MGQNSDFCLEAQRSRNTASRAIGAGHYEGVGVRKHRGILRSAHADRERNLPRLVRSQANYDDLIRCAGKYLAIEANAIRLVTHRCNRQFRVPDRGDNLQPARSFRNPRINRPASGRASGAAGQPSFCRQLISPPRHICLRKPAVVLPAAPRTHSCCWGRKARRPRSVPSLSWRCSRSTPPKIIAPNRPLPTGNASVQWVAGF